MRRAYVFGVVAAALGVALLWTFFGGPDHTGAFVLHRVEDEGQLATNLTDEQLARLPSAFREALGEAARTGRASVNVPAREAEDILAAIRYGEHRKDSEPHRLRYAGSLFECRFATA